MPKVIHRLSTTHCGGEIVRTWGPSLQSVAGVALRESKGEAWHEGCIRYRHMSKQSIAAESYRNALWAVIASPVAPEWAAHEALGDARMALYRAGGRRLHAKVHNHMVRKMHKRAAMLAWLAAD